MQTPPLHRCRSGCTVRRHSRDKRRPRSDCRKRATAGRRIDRVPARKRISSRGAQPLSCSSDKSISQKKHVDPRPRECLESVIRRSHQRLQVIERSVEDEWNAAKLAKPIDQRMKKGILLRVDELVCGRFHPDAQLPGSRAPLGAHAIGQNHEAPTAAGPLSVARECKPRVGLFGKDRGPERPERLPVFDSAIELLA